MDSYVETAALFGAVTDEKMIVLGVTVALTDKKSDAAELLGWHSAR